MKYIERFRDSRAAKALEAQLIELSSELKSRTDPVRIMEVCGTHTMSIARYGIRSILPDNIDLISGPGCPVCVTDSGYIDAAIELALDGACVVSFGDMLKVPGTDLTLAEARSRGAEVHVCYSPLEAIKLSRQNPHKRVVFLAIGFETTICPALGLLEKTIKEDITNLSLLTAFKLVPPALDLLARSPDLAIDAFLCPAHVSAIIGANAYHPLAEKYGLPAVVAGFEPLDILYGLCGILRQIGCGEARVENQYSRVVKPQGNLRALALIDKYLEPVDTVWRGLGEVPESGLKIRREFSAFDAEEKFAIRIEPGKEIPGCQCGGVLKGVVKPPECKLFGTVCSPAKPIGPCMVSSEGSCSAFYRYGGNQVL